MDMLAKVNLMAIVHENFDENTIAEDYRKMILAASEELVSRGYAPLLDIVLCDIDWWGKTKIYPAPSGKIIRGVGIAKVSVMGIKEE